MAWDDPVVWVLIFAMVIFLFGSDKLPQIARALGEAKKEFDSGLREFTAPSKGATTQNFSTPDPLIVAARREGIETTGKTKQQIASELAWKLKSDQSGS
ncbi:MAG: twin-arginine translocase TatA/TatE family subunit [Thaumarchaeota archaeon]|nr:twin-arginine translocase TatA/TatE family subunit [Nitrososphaerota archaeon]